MDSKPLTKERLALQKERAIHLRLQERKSIAEIQTIVQCAKSTLSLWLRPYPLTASELHERRIHNLPAPRKKERGGESSLHSLLNGRELTRDAKGRIAERAVHLRLEICGFPIWRKDREGAKSDFGVVSRHGRLLHIQVKWVKRHAVGLPSISMLCSNGRGKTRRYNKTELDFLVGYDLFTDTAYVYCYVDLDGRQNTIAISDAHAEAWEKVRLEIED
jgi:hypothetical protein